MAEIGREINPEEKEKIVGSQEQPKEEPKGQPTGQPTEEPKEQPGGEPKEEPKEEPKGEPKEEPRESLVEAFNKKFGADLGKEFKEEDEIKAFIEKAGEYDSLKTSSDELNQKLGEYKKLAEGVNPLSYFVNEDEYVRQQFLKNNKDKLSKEAIDSLSALSPERVKEMNEKDALTTDLIVNNGLTREEAQAYINKKYDVEDGEDMDVGTRAEMKVDVNSAKQRLSKMYEGIDVPEKVDWESARQQLKESWEAPLAETIKGLDRIKLADGVEFVVDDAMKQGLEQEVLSGLLTNGTKPTEEALKNVVGGVRDKLLLRNMDKVVKSIESDLREKIKSEVRQEIHNDKPISDSSRSGGGSKDRDQQILNAW